MKDKTIISYGFLIALTLLLLNDFYLKKTYPGIITGKLSDFAGLFIFPLFLAYFFPNRKKEIYLFTFLGFIIWKLPLADNLINLWNTHFYYQIGRAIDYTDYFALAILPISYYYNPKPKFMINKKYLKIIIACITVFSIIATAGSHGKIKAYKFNYSKKQVYQAFLNFYKKYPQYVVPEKYESYKTPHYGKGTEKKGTVLSRLDADSVNFDFYIEEDTLLIIWSGFILTEKNWNKNVCELALIGCIEPGKKWHFDKHLRKEEKIKITSLFESEILTKLQNILSKEHNKIN